jgi:hypothetical protein
MLDAIAGLDLAIESLYHHTDFHNMGRKVYHRTIEGTLKPEQEEKLRKLAARSKSSLVYLKRFTANCSSLSSVAGIPSGRTPPLPFGM